MFCFPFMLTGDHISMKQSHRFISIYFYSPPPLFPLSKISQFWSFLGCKAITFVTVDKRDHDWFRPEQYLLIFKNTQPFLHALADEMTWHWMTMPVWQSGPAELFVSNFTTAPRDRGSNPRGGKNLNNLYVLYRTVIIIIFTITCVLMIGR